MPIFRDRAQRKRVFWYVRIAAYLLFLGATLLMVNGLRGRIPMMFGVTPVRIDPLTVRRIARPGRSDTVDVSVTVRVVGRDTIPGGLALGQFRLRGDDDREYMPFATSFPFEQAGGFQVAKGDTVIGGLYFALPAKVEPRELWWRP